MLFAFAVLVGLASRATDVAINDDARAEVGSGASLLNLAHACFSVAVVGASVATGLLRAADAGPLVVFSAAAALVAVASQRQNRAEREPATWEEDGACRPAGPFNAVDIYPATTGAERPRAPSARNRDLRALPRRIEDGRRAVGVRFVDEETCAA
jgi:hypothetical protein